MTTATRPQLQYLHDALEDFGALKLNESNASYEAIHRSMLAGLIGHVARYEERNTYKAAGNRMVSVFPGSALHSRGEPPKRWYWAHPPVALAATRAAIWPRRQRWRRL